ncbi:hypothetical protein [Bacillus sp. AFS041924]|uniref:hypothetical protein n=1 Tax=Bacillus sp. AFS041924 TaxID=2033503 RepID=UPI000BFBE0EA|nr:hypothetical protein [Bacillus sp. AFS041924]PGS46983.1 hypothetical protein COC46_20460 [Bacillus sp. AFS041924]
MQSNKYNHLLFARGYIISKKGISSPHSNWKKMNIGNYIVQFDPKLDYYFDEKISSNGNQLFILGMIYDISDSTLSNKEIYFKLIEKLTSSEDSFFDYLDQLAGRYLIFYQKDDSFKILQDAAGLRSVYYSKNEEIISSHVELLAQICGSHPINNDLLTKSLKYTSFHLPGNISRYEDLFCLTPNTLLCWPKIKVSRFWPRKPIANYSIEEATTKIYDLVNEQLKYFKKIDKKILFSLTAGIDSRTSLALLKDHINNCEFFTYYKSNTAPVKSLAIDLDVSKNLASNLRLNQKILEIDYNVANTEFNQILSKNNEMNHSYRLAKLYYDNYDDSYIHIRSNIFEIGRAFYKKELKKNLKPYDGKNINPVEIVRCYNSKAIEDIEILNLFKTFLETVEFTADRIFNLDPYDLLYWEYRMGAWHSNILLESDVAFDTLILFNARNILSIMLGVNLRARLQNDLFKNIITTYWPILNYWKINSKETIADYYDPLFDEFGKNLPSILINSGNTKNTSKQVEYMAKQSLKRLQFHLVDSAPKLGDFVEATINLDTEKSKAYKAYLHLRTPYQNASKSKRLEYSVYLNETLLFKEDIAFSNETNQIQLNWIAKSDHDNIKVRISSLKNCESSNWGVAGKLLIERFTINHSDLEDFTISISSPFSIMNKEILDIVE